MYIYFYLFYLALFFTLMSLAPQTLAQSQIESKNETLGFHQLPSYMRSQSYEEVKKQLRRGQLQTTSAVALLFHCPQFCERVGLIEVQNVSGQKAYRVLWDDPLFPLPTEDFKNMEFVGSSSKLFHILKNQKSKVRTRHLENPKIQTLSRDKESEKLFAKVGSEILLPYQKNYWSVSVHLQTDLATRSVSGSTGVQSRLGSGAHTAVGSDIHVVLPWKPQFFGLDTQWFTELSFFQSLSEKSSEENHGIATSAYSASLGTLFRYNNNLFLGPLLKYQSKSIVLGDNWPQGTSPRPDLSRDTNTTAYFYGVSLFYLWFSLFYFRPLSSVVIDSTNLRGNPTLDSSQEVQAHLCPSYFKWGSIKIFPCLGFRYSRQQELAPGNPSVPRLNRVSQVRMTETSIGVRFNFQRVFQRSIL